MTTGVWPGGTAVTWGRTDEGIDGTVPPGTTALAIVSGTVEILHDPSGFGQNYAVLHFDQPLTTPCGTYFAMYYGHLIPSAPDGGHVSEGIPVAVAGAHGGGNAFAEVGGFELGFWTNGPAPGSGDCATQFFKGQAPGVPQPGGTPGGDSAGNQVQTFFNDDPSPVNGGDMLGLTDPQNNLPLLWDRAKSPFITNLLHGSMKTVAPPHFTVYFMFNPQSVDFSYGFNSSAIPIAYQDNSLQNNAQVLMNQTITFSLLFDRIYEVGYWDWSNKHGRATPNLNFQLDDVWGAPSGPHTDGVNWDIRAVERLVGIYDKTLTQPPAGTDPNNPGATPAPGQLISNAGVAMGNAVDVALGSKAAPIFRGYVGGLSVNYTRFTEKMVPVRAELQVTLIRLPIPHPNLINVPGDYNPYVTTPLVY